MAKYKAYPEYKDSGVEWLGEIPTHWICTQIKYGYDITLGKMLQKNKSSSKDELKPYLKAQNIQPTGIDLSVVDNMWFSPDEKNKLLLKNDDVLISEGGDVGRSALWQGQLVECYIQNAINRARAIKGNSPYFLNYWMVYLKSADFINTLCNKATIAHYTAEKVETSPLLLPNSDEQFHISLFLDHETAKIDSLIDKQQQLIELLKEKRQAVISHAVTKGLNPDVPMKNSGVEWLGDVPEHWGVMPVKYVCALIKDGTHLPPPRVENGIPLLSVRNIIGGVFQFRDDDSQISHKDYKSLCSSFIPKKDDVLLAIVGATLGKVALVPEMDSFHIQRSLGVFRTNKLIHPQHLSYIFESKDFQNLLWENAGFSAQPGIYLGTLSNFCVPVPPVTEQLKISEFITTTVDKLDLLITQASQLIGLIQERRTALISAAVTGKIDVRDWVAPDTQDVKELQEATV